MTYDEMVENVASELGDLLYIFGLENGDDLSTVDEYDTPEEALEDYLQGHAIDILDSIGIVRPA